jgi:nucleolar GTP-binding protein
LSAVEWRRIPTVLRVDELIDKAFLRASKQPGLVDDPDKYHRVRKQMVRMIQSAADTLSTTLRTWISRWPSLDRLSSFDVALIDAAVGCDLYRQNLGGLQWAADRIDNFCRKGQRLIARQRRIEDFHETRREVYGRCVSVLEQVSDQIHWLGEARDVMRTFPMIDAKEPCIVVAGAPNVGKSALIAALSTGEPEVAAYPFTTRRLHVGHFTHRRQVHQLVDTPGLLDRPMEQRNDIELQAIAALSHVGDIVLFLIDATETSESSLESQLSLKSEIEMLLDDTPMITVIGKADLLGLDDWQAAFDASKAIQLATQAEVEPSEPESRVESEAEEAESIEPVSEVEAGPEEVEAEGVEDEKHRHKSNKEEEIEEPILIYKPLDSRAISPLTGTGLEPLRSEMIRMIAEKNVIPRLELPEDWPVRRITADRPPIEDY